MKDMKADAASNFLSKIKMIKFSVTLIALILVFSIKAELPDGFIDRTAIGFYAQ
jgi:hypothetical protein